MHGVAAVTLQSGDLEATFVPELNMLGTSLRLGGEEFLALPGGVGAYRRQHTTGLPLLAPWANRLGAQTYRSNRRRVELEALALHRDENGLPIHGTLTAAEPWNVTALVGPRSQRAPARDLRVLEAGAPGRVSVSSPARRSWSWSTVARSR